MTTRSGPEDVKGRSAGPGLRPYTRLRGSTTRGADGTLAGLRAPEMKGEEEKRKRGGARGREVSVRLNSHWLD